MNDTSLVCGRLLISFRVEVLGGWLLHGGVDTLFVPGALGLPPSPSIMKRVHDAKQDGN